MPQDDDVHPLVHNPAPPPACAWEKFCQDLPILYHQMEELAQAQITLAERMRTMDDRDRSMAMNIAALHDRQGQLKSQMNTQGEQLSQIVTGVNMLAGSPSNFVGIAQEVGGSVKMTKRIGGWIVALATAIAALWGVFHLTEGKGQTTEPTQLNER